jgi:hypothetical protein
MLSSDITRRPTFREAMNELIGVEINHLTDQAIIPL